VLLSFSHLLNAVLLFLLINFHEVFRDLAVGFVLVNGSSVFTGSAACTNRLSSSLHGKGLSIRVGTHNLSARTDSDSLPVSTTDTHVLALTGHSSLLRIIQSSIDFRGRGLRWKLGFS